MARTEGGSVPNGVGYGEGCPLSSRLEGLGERRELSSGQGFIQPPQRGGVLPSWKILLPPNQALLTPPSGVVYHKIAYMRCLKDWELLHNCLSADLVAVY